MKPRHIQLPLMALALALLLAPLAWAQNAPGVDPIVLDAPVSYLTLPTAPFQPSDGLDNFRDIPSWLQARVARFEAQAFAKLEGGSGLVQTEQDVVSRQVGNTLNRTCVTEVASNTVAPGIGPSGQYGPGSRNDQIAVIRGNVVTICK